MRPQGISSGDFTGSLGMPSASLTGSAVYHYDEARGDVSGGSSNAYKVASWIEDIE
jgi:hypothetical protein